MHSPRGPGPPTRPGAGTSGVRAGGPWTVCPETHDDYESSPILTCCGGTDGRCGGCTPIRGMGSRERFEGPSASELPDPYRRAGAPQRVTTRSGTRRGSGGNENRYLGASPQLTRHRRSALCGSELQPGAGVCGPGDALRPTQPAPRRAPGLQRAQWPDTRPSHALPACRAVT